MNWKNTALHAILNGKCPRCHEGDMFLAGTLYSTKFSQMNEKCACCGQHFEPEPGYYYGAMFVSYAFSMAIFIGIWILMEFLAEEVTLGMMVAGLIASVILLLPLNFRLSRSIWIKLFIRYEGPGKMRSSAEA